MSQPPTSDWLPMTSAPRDGDVVELRCSFSRKPWYGIFRWSSEYTSSGQEITLRPGESARGCLSVEGKILAGIKDSLEKPCWVNAEPGQTTLIADDAHLSWRPYSGNPAYYVDPTNGEQYGLDYWRELTNQTSYLGKLVNNLKRFLNW